MAKWQEPENPESLHSDVILPGHGLGVIDPSKFEPATWEHKLTYTMGRRQYGQFVAAIVERIRAGESGPDEVHKFTKLLETEPNWSFLTVAVPHVPELKENYPNDPNHPELALLFNQMRRRLRQRKNFLESESSAHILWNTSYKNGLKKEEKALLRHNMFGPDVGAEDSESMKRLFKSTLELGFPQDALTESESVAKARGEDIYRDHQGLPCGLRMPDPPGQPTEVAGSSPRFQTPGSSVGPTRVGPSSSIHDDSPPPDLLVEEEPGEAIHDSKSRVQKQLPPKIGWSNTAAAPGSNLPPRLHIVDSPPGVLCPAHGLGIPFHLQQAQSFQATRVHNELTPPVPRTAPIHVPGKTPEKTPEPFIKDKCALTRPVSSRISSAELELSKH